MASSRSNSLTRPLSRGEQHLLEIVVEPYFTYGGIEWPVWDFVERRMLQDLGVDARPVMTGLPKAKVKGRYAISSYGLVYPTVWQAPHPIASDASDRIGLTVAGLAHFADEEQACSRIEAVLMVVSHLSDLEATAVPDPAKPVVIHVSWSEITALLVERHAQHSESWRASVLDLLKPRSTAVGLAGSGPVRAPVRSPCLPRTRQHRRRCRGLPRPACRLDPAIGGRRSARAAAAGSHGHSRRPRPPGRCHQALGQGNWWPCCCSARRAGIRV